MEILCLKLKEYFRLTKVPQDCIIYYYRTTTDMWVGRPEAVFALEVSRAQRRRQNVPIPVDSRQKTKTGLVVFLLMICFLVMHAGFALLECDSVRCKNATSILFRNVLDACKSYFMHDLDKFLKNQNKRYLVIYIPSNVLVYHYLYYSVSAVYLYSYRMSTAYSLA